MLIKKFKKNHEAKMKTLHNIFFVRETEGD